MADWVRLLIEQWGYAGVAFLMFAETVFPPIPSEVIMSLSGLQAARGTMGLGGAIVAGTAGAMAGNIVWYAVARALGLDRFRPLVDRFGRWLTLDWREVHKGEDFFREYGHWFVCLGRMVPTIRSLVSIPAGLVRMPFLPFVIWSTIGTLGWSAALAYGGYLLGSRFVLIDEYLGPASTAVILACAAWYLYRVTTWRPRT